MMILVVISFTDVLTKHMYFPWVEKYPTLCQPDLFIDLSYSPTPCPPKQNAENKVFKDKVHSSLIFLPVHNFLSERSCFVDNKLVPYSLYMHLFYIYVYICLGYISYGYMRSNINVDNKGKLRESMLLLCCNSCIKASLLFGL